MRVSIFGLGYVGCVTATGLARAGHRVIGVDVNAEKVAVVNAGTPPVVEPGLEAVLAEMTQQGYLRATTSSDDAVGETDLAMICVGTPGRANGRPDVSAVEQVGREIGSALRRRDRAYTVVLRSTALPGTTEGVLIPALSAGAGRLLDGPVRVAVNPHEVMRVFLMDHKLNISEAYLRPGFAFGGSCLPKDLRALVSAGRAADLPSPVLSAILPSNELQVRRAIEAVLGTRKRRVGVVGLAFKPGTDDLRESPMVALVEALIGKGLDVRVIDPNVAVARLVGANRRYIEEEIPHIASLMCESVEAMLDHAEVLVIGSASEEARRALAASRPEHIVVDLTRGAAGSHSARLRPSLEVSAMHVPPSGD